MEDDDTDWRDDKLMGVLAREQGNEPPTNPAALAREMRSAILTLARIWALIDPASAATEADAIGSEVVRALGR